MKPKNTQSMTTDKLFRQIGDRSDSMQTKESGFAQKPNGLEKVNFKGATSSFGDIMKAIDLLTPAIKTLGFVGVSILEVSTFAAAAAQTKCCKHQCLSMQHHQPDFNQPSFR